MKAIIYALPLTLLLAAPASAQANYNPPATTAPAATPAPVTTTPAEQRGMGHDQNVRGATWFNEIDRSFFARDVIGMDVRNNNNDALGDVHDAIVHPSGRITHLVISHGGVLGIGSKKARLAFERFRLSGDRSFLVLDMSEAQVEGLPEINEERFDLKRKFEGREMPAEDRAGDNKKDEKK